MRFTDARFFGNMSMTNSVRFRRWNRHRSAGLLYSVSAILIATGAVGCGSDDGVDYSDDSGTDFEEDSGTDSNRDCEAGYTRVGDSCKDIDECALGKYQCGKNSFCVNTDGSYICECNEGYIKDGTACVANGPCEKGLDECAQGATCISVGNSYQCDCPAGVKANCYKKLRALAVIVDFADAKLEDYVNPKKNAIVSENDIRIRTDEMSKHFKYLSAGTREIVWDIERTTLQQKRTPTAFKDWTVFRQAAVDSAKKHIDFSKYDFDGDGSVDAMWLIASVGATSDQYPYFMGGMSRHDGACVWVDGQGGDGYWESGIPIGNYNHELGHCLGLPDIYGDYDTLGHLSLMSDSWPIPPTAFSAYDRTLMSWTIPRVINASTKNVVLKPWEQGLEAVRIPTTRDFEYFLVEYRRQPSSGFGSTPKIGYDGLAIYHVYDARLNSGGDGVYPPLIRLVRANGFNDPKSSDLKPEHFWSPENAKMLDAFEGISYLQNKPEVKINNIKRTSDNNLSFDVQILQPQLQESKNLLVNGDFEQASGNQPSAWNMVNSDAQRQLSWERDCGRNNSGCLRVQVAEEMADVAFWSRWQQSVSELQVGSTYELSGWVRGEGVHLANNSADGALLTVLGQNWIRSQSFVAGSFDWTHVAVTFKADKTNMTFACHLGYGIMVYNLSSASGTVWFDDLKLVKVPD